MSALPTGKEVYETKPVGEAKKEITDENESSKASGIRRSSAGRRMSGSGITPPSAANRLRLYKSNSRSKWVTREIAALEFLLGVPLESEQEIVQKGWMQQQGIVHDRTKAAEDDEEEKVEILEPPNQSTHSRSSQFANNPTFHGRWWEKWINNPKQSGGDLVSRRSRVEEDELEQPSELGVSRLSGPNDGQRKSQPVAVPVHAPGRRLQGDDATKVQIPISDEASIVTRQKNIARLAFTREWEIKVAHGIGDISSKRPTTAANASIPSRKQVRPPMLDGRLFFSAGESYPMQVFSLLRYEPKKEEAARRRQKLEARGGGGTQFFIMPVRDWRGISYRALLPSRKPKSHRSRSVEALLRFDRFATSSSDNLDGRSKAIGDGKDADRSADHDLENHDDDSDSSDEDEDTYLVGLLDDPGMVQGRHRNVMIGDRVTGPIVSSTIQFVKPQLLKADLNKQFRERFEGWEPPKSQRKYIGARVVDGVYTLMDPGTVADDATIGTSEEDSHLQTVGTNATTTTANTSVTPRKRQGSISSMSTGGDAKENIRMPPSLTLSKIRSIKRQALLAAVTAKLEISTVALSIVYFERLCLDCRVDKTNRRLSFAACLLLALKMNEAHVELVMAKPDEDNSKNSATNRIQSLIRPAKKSGNVFASLLEFFTQEWNLSLKHLFAAEWGVFAALQFRLHAKPSQVAFHFKRLLKAMDWNPRAYLGPRMFSYWMDALADEEYHRIQREERREARKQLKEHKKLLQLQRELAAVNRSELGSNSISHLVVGDQREDSDRREGNQMKAPTSIEEDLSPVASPKKGTGRPGSRPARIGRILNPFAGGKRAHSSDRLSIDDTDRAKASSESDSKIKLSPSMPTFPTSADVPQDGSFIIDIPTEDGTRDESNALSERTAGEKDDYDDEAAGIIID